MEPERTSPHSAPVTNDMTVPQLPFTPEALPIFTSDASSMPRPRGRERQQSQDSLLMELLSRRMSRQSLLQQQQNQSRTSQPPLAPQSPQPPMDSSSHSRVDSGWSAFNSMHMEIDVDETCDNDASIPTSSSRTQSIRPSRRYRPLPHIAPVAPATSIDPDVASRVLARMQANTQPALDSVPLPANSSPAPVIEIDPSELAGADLQADEGYDEGPDEFPWLGEKPSSGLTGVLRSQGLLSFTTSAEAAMRCPKLVRNVPRMRKRTQKKKEHRLRASKGTTGEPSQAQASTVAAG
ncbi:uncharacterized protein TRIREDRAFT_108559 [Trichoderma reesei QM6a]|uniref:Predicted protein n=2 Tax=Hypocrea jecorina TaxID=51453 RepID=G0RLW3_HYPJQ|nr:uncharacterized protein TRIREDRAFT_108559 [Trichoderma reesei QM6a]EGR47687.1 predicted protein [Trichoderma reesei QM6a]ETS01140.1 hypothetical protein M419DRAFT_130772 [Trichoderma reesei RUT C-30]